MDSFGVKKTWSSRLTYEHCWIFHGKTYTNGWIIEGFSMEHGGFPWKRELYTITNISPLALYITNILVVFFIILVFLFETMVSVDHGTSTCSDVLHTRCSTPGAPPGAPPVLTSTPWRPLRWTGWPTPWCPSWRPPRPRSADLSGVARHGRHNLGWFGTWFKWLV